MGVRKHREEKKNTQRKGSEKKWDREEKERDLKKKLCFISCVLLASSLRTDKSDSAKKCQFRTRVLSVIPTALLVGRKGKNPWDWTVGNGAISSLQIGQVTDIRLAPHGMVLLFLFFFYFFFCIFPLFEPAQNSVK